jgi:putative transposase
MTRKGYKPEEIVAKLRQVDVLVSQGQGMTEAIRQIGMSEVTYYRWRRACEVGGSLLASRTAWHLLAQATCT